MRADVLQHMRRTARHITMFTAGAGLLAAAGLAAGAPVNPTTAPIDITVPTSATQVTTVRVVQASTGQVVATLPPIQPVSLAPSGGAASTTPTSTTTTSSTTVHWSGGRGTGGTGQVVADGDYKLDAQLTDGTTVPVAPVTVGIDTTPPEIGLIPGTPTVPVRRAKGIPMHASADAQVRAVVRRPGTKGEVLATGGWAPAGDTLSLPGLLRRKGVVGLVTVTAEARDAAGNTSSSDPILWSVQPTGSGARVVTHVKTRRPLVAVTVDDGYGPGEAMRMIQAARDAGVTITFCFNAINQSMWHDDFRTAIRTAVEDGVLEVCNHGYSHTTGVGTSQGAGMTDLAKNAPWDAIAGYSTAPFYRPPFGAYGAGLRAAAAAEGYRYILLWDVDTNDWKGPPSSSVITQRAVGGAHKGSIILMHTKPNTAAAFPGILRGLKAKGLRPVGLSELFTAGTPAR